MAADFELAVDEKAFTCLGVRVHFDENKYAGLLAMLAEGFEYKRPTVAIKPHALWAAVGSGSMWQMYRIWLPTRQRQPLILQGGDYDQKTATLNIGAEQDRKLTNERLLHETRHWADDVRGEPEDFRTTVGRVSGTMSYVIAAGAGFGVSELLGGGLGIAAGVATGLVVNLGGYAIVGHYAYRERPHEIRAREFAADPERLAEFGHIITYESLE